MTPFGDNDQAFAMADFAYKKLKTRNVVIWRDESTRFTRILAAYFKERYLALGGNILEEFSFKEGRRDFSALVRTVRKLAPQPDAIFISGNPGDAIPIVRQLRDAGLKLPLLSGDGFDVDLIARLPRPQDWNDVYFASHAYLRSKRPEMIGFVNAYRREYGTAPESSFAALGYDALSLLADAIDRAGSTEPSAVTKALAETRGFKGVTGDISFTRPSRVPVVPVSIVGVRNGKYRLMEQWVPDNPRP
jgi:branched-chain amino acid transport system substrate-binding protein